MRRSLGASLACVARGMIALLVLVASLPGGEPTVVGPEFPPELVEFTPYESNPVFAGTGTNTWDRKIRERGYILREDGVYHLWYTGYRGERDEEKHLGYATSADGLHWTRSPLNPIYDKGWVEDVQVVKHGGAYFMFAEGRNDIAHMLVSPDGIRWTEQGNLDIRYTSGKPLSPGPYGTPTVWIEGSTWRLFYERNDRGIWLAKSTDAKVWTNVQDEPVIACGPDDYDREAVALNQVISYKGRYYGVYHSLAPEVQGAHASSARSNHWITNLAVSSDLVHWKKYPKNPVVSGDKSSGILVHDGDRWRLYTMHPDIRVYFSRQR